LTLRNRYFYTEVQSFANFQCRFIWVYFHGTPEEAVHYSYRIKITGIGGKELTFKGKVFSMNASQDTIVANDDVFKLSDDTAKRFQNGNVINFDIKLFTDKEEIKDEDVESGISDDD
jgi:hypothetical protein